jgi:hypothetical protein
MIIVLPLIVFFLVRDILSNPNDKSNNQATTIAGVSAIFTVNIVIAVYVIIILKDPNNWSHETKYFDGMSGDDRKLLENN